jgi:hypothetical protein
MKIHAIGIKLGMLLENEKKTVQNGYTAVGRSEVKQNGF